MQKKLIALAVAGLVSAPAFAQSNVQIYGVADAGFTNYKSGDNKFRGVESGLLSASRIGFRGTEDLGNGLKGLFVLEYGINVDTGSGPQGARQSFVGLQGDYGFVGLGRQYSPGHNLIGTLDVMGGSAAFSPYLDITSSTIANAGAGRWNNAISYKSPNMSGFSVEAMYAFGEDADQADAFGERDTNNRYGIGAGYKNGPLRAALVYHNTTFESDVGGADDDRKEWMIGGGYDFGVVDMNLAYINVKNVEGIDDLDEKTWYLNGAIPVSAAGKVLVGYAQAKYDVPGVSDQKIKAYTLAYTHGLSKRTTAYAGYTYVDNDDLGDFVPVNALDGSAGDSAKGFAIGVRHTF